jgi:hypothetical protein
VLTVGALAVGLLLADDVALLPHAVRVRARTPLTTPLTTNRMSFFTRILPVGTPGFDR